MSDSVFGTWKRYFQTENLHQVSLYCGSCKWTTIGYVEHSFNPFRNLQKRQLFIESFTRNWPKICCYTQTNSIKSDLNLNDFVVREQIGTLHNVVIKLACIILYFMGCHLRLTIFESDPPASDDDGKLCWFLVFSTSKNLNWDVR